MAPTNRADTPEVKVSYTQLIDSTLADVPFVVRPYKLELEPQTKTRYLQIIARHTPRRGWLFLDEVVVR